jgi:hypothetical protein
MKLNPEDLDVVSFDTTVDAGGDTDTSRVAALQPILIINDPTAATRCFICPPITRDYRCL